MSTSRGSAEGTARFEAVGVIAKAIGSDGTMLLRDVDTVSLGQLVGETVFLVPPPLRKRSRVVEAIELAADGVRILLSGVEDRGTAQGLVGLQIIAASSSIVSSSAVLDTEQGEDLIGWRVHDSESGFDGVITEYFETRAHPIVQVESESATALIPLVDEFILDVDDDARTIHVQLIEGMVEER